MKKSRLSLSGKTTRLYQPFFSALRNLSQHLLKSCSVASFGLQRVVSRPREPEMVCLPEGRPHHQLQGPKLLTASHCSLLFNCLCVWPAVDFICDPLEAQAKTEERRFRRTRTRTRDHHGLRFLFENYKDNCWFWELVEMTRKLIPTSGLILISGESRAYVWIIFCIQESNIRSI